MWLGSAGTGVGVQQGHGPEDWVVTSAPSWGFVEALMVTSGGVSFGGIGRCAALAHTKRGRSISSVKRAALAHVEAFAALARTMLPLLETH